MVCRKIGFAKHKGLQKIYFKLLSFKYCSTSNEKQGLKIEFIINNPTTAFFAGK